MKPTLEASVVWSDHAESRHSPAANPAENRKEHRYVVDQSVLVFAPGASARMWSARIRDISGRGMQLVVEEAISFGPEIKIRWNGRDVNGTIRYNHKFDEARYRIGIELRSSSEPLLIEILARQSEDLQQARLLLKRQENLLNSYATLLDLAPQAMIVTSMDGAVVYWNRAAERIYGWPREEALGRQVNHLFESRLPAELSANGLEATVFHVRKNGSVVSVTSRSVVQGDFILLVNRES
ncbi:MAG: hypothetical protein C5B51_31825 [Terriglobia bacterium]|nr:MAG: hypothetical protein C5B51_31825 [Terriglobia bacterium]